MIGTIKYMLAPQQITATFTKAELVIVTEEQHPQTIKFELHNQACNELQGKAIGQRVFVNFNIRGREYVKDGNISVFNTLVAWKLTPQ